MFAGQEEKQEREKAKNRKEKRRKTGKRKGEKQEREKEKNRKPGYEPFLQTVVKQKRFCERQHCSTSAGTSQVGPQ